jgi:hypothetical protein
MSFRDRHASAPMSPVAYWLTCILGMLLGFAIFALPLFLLTRRCP